MSVHVDDAGDHDGSFNYGRTTGHVDLLADSHDLPVLDEDYAVLYDAVGDGVDAVAAYGERLGGCGNRERCERKKGED